MVEVNTMYTIRNFGRRTNCTVSLLYEGSFQILSMIVGHSHRPIGNLLSSRNFLVETSLLKKVSRQETGWSQRTAALQPQRTELGADKIIHGKQIY